MAKKVDVKGERNPVPASLFGSNPKLKPFTKSDEAEFHDL
jgi:hypothetical protein